MALIKKDASSVKIVDTKKAEELLSRFIDIALYANKSIAELKDADSKRLRRGNVEVKSKPEGINVFDKLRDFELDRLGYEIGALDLMYKSLKHSEFKKDTMRELKFIKQLKKDLHVRATSKLGQMEEAKFKADLAADGMLRIAASLKRSLVPESILDVDKKMQIDSYIGTYRAYENELTDSFLRYIEKLKKSSEVEYLKLRFKRE